MKIKSLLVFLFLLYGSTVSVQAATFSLEITNIKPAGQSGSDPAIAATNRIFRAYPGIEYNIRAAVIGGVYPYTHSLSNAPAGMTINSRTGEISWPNPQSNSGTITLSVTDSTNETVETSWAITVGTSGFHFVDVNAPTNGTGTKDSPFNSLNNFLTATFNGTTSDIVYFRGGTYDLVSFNAGVNPSTNINSNPRAWLAYPGETVTFQGSTDTGKAATIVCTTGHTGLYFDSFTFKDMSNQGFYLAGAGDYYTIRRNVFDGLAPRDGVNNNYGFIYTSNNGEVMKYVGVIQDNEFKNWYRSAAIGSLYYQSKLLIENNFIHSPSSATTPGGILVTLGLAIKSNLPYLTVRGNHIDMDYGTIVGTSINNWFHIEYMDMVYNYFRHYNSGQGIQFNGQESSTGPNKYHNIKRNTIIDVSASYGFNPCQYNSGPFYIKENVLIIGTNSLNSACVDYADNVTSASIDTATGKLSGVSETYIGTRGWQFADGSTPMEAPVQAQIGGKMSGGGAISAGVHTR